MVGKPWVKKKKKEKKEKKKGALLTRSLYE